MLYNISKIKIQFDAFPQVLSVYKMDLGVLDSEVLNSNIRSLYENGVFYPAQNGNNFEGTTVNNKNHPRMLCVPLIYNDSWIALLDGVQTEVNSINGGLIGIVVPAGEHSIKLTYVNNTPKIGRFVGTISFFALTMVCFVTHIKSLIDRKKYKAVD